MTKENEVVVEVVEPEKKEDPEKAKKIKKYVKFGVTALVGALGGFLLGWYSSPCGTKVETPEPLELPFEPDTAVETDNF